MRQPIPLIFTSSLAAPFTSQTAANFIRSSIPTKYLVEPISINLTKFVTKDLINALGMREEISLQVGDWIHEDTARKCQAIFWEYLSSSLEHLQGKYLTNALLLAGSYLLYQGVKSRATYKVHELIRLFTQKNTFLCGLHHMLLIPYVTAMNKPGK